MRKENGLQERKAGKFKLKMAFAILILVALSIVELYLMMNYSTEYLYLCVVGLVILCFVYWAVDISFKIQGENDEIREKEYETLYKAQKVSYINMKQEFLDMEEILKKLTELVDLPVDDVIQSQKAIGKVTIQRNKENAQEIMDSHKELTERMDTFESKLNELKEIFGLQQEILDAIRRLEAAIASASISTAMQETRVPITTEEPLADTSFIEKMSVTEEEPIAEASIQEELAKTEEAVVVEEPIAEASIQEELAETEEAVAVEEPIAEDTIIDIDNLLDDLVMSEMSEAVPEEKPPMPDLSDPNHIMTPEEIAALLANM